MGRLAELDELVLPVLLEHVEEALLVLDSERSLRYVNDRARRLLGYGEAGPEGSRCKLTTQGIDCDRSCPLTYALERGLDRVENFTTVYHAANGAAVPLSVTVIPLLDSTGAFRGALEILRPADPDPGFMLAGRGAFSLELRRRVGEAARSGRHLILVGESPAVADVARAAHRLSGLSEELFHGWPGSWEDLPSWPPGTVFAVGAAGRSILGGEPPEGWRVMVGVAKLAELQPPVSLPHEVLELPRARDLGEDLPLVVSSWLARLAPRTEVTPAALARLTRMVRELGFEGLQGPLNAAVAVAGECLDEGHISAEGFQSAYIDDLLQRPDPLAAMEERLLTEVLNRSGWRMQEAADRLGISRVTLWRKLRDHGIERPDGSDSHSSG